MMMVVRSMVLFSLMLAPVEASGGWCSIFRCGEPRKNKPKSDMDPAPVVKEDELWETWSPQLENKHVNVANVSGSKPITEKEMDVHMSPQEAVEKWDNEELLNCKLVRRGAGAGTDSVPNFVLMDLKDLNRNGLREIVKIEKLVYKDGSRIKGSKLADLRRQIRDARATQSIRRGAGAGTDRVLVIPNDDLKYLSMDGLKKIIQNEKLVDENWDQKKRNTMGILRGQIVVARRRKAERTTKAKLIEALQNLRRSCTITNLRQFNISFGLEVDEPQVVTIGEIQTFVNKLKTQWIEATNEAFPESLVAVWAFNMRRNKMKNYHKTTNIKNVKNAINNFFRQHNLSETIFDDMKSVLQERLDGDK